MGEAGSGKDFLAKELAATHPDIFHYIVSTTSRPIREGEQNGVDYHYLTQYEFDMKMMDGNMLEYTYFNSWGYGTCKDDLVNDKINIGVFNPTGIRSLQNRNDITLQTYRLGCTPKIRLLRQLNREENPNIDEIVRRYTTDKIDFSDLSDITYIALPNSRWEDIPPNEEIIINKAKELLGQNL